MPVIEEAQELVDQIAVYEDLQRDYEEALAEKIEEVIHENGNRDLDGSVLKLLAKKRVDPEIKDKYHRARVRWSELTWSTKMQSEENNAAALQAFKKREDLTYDIYRGKS